MIAPYRPFIVLTLLLVLAGLACRLAGSTPAPSQDTDNLVQTVVAGTLSAQPTPLVETAIPVPSRSPLPTATPEPTSTPVMPTTSPATSALRLAYIKDGNVYVWMEGEGSVGLTSTHDAVDVRISPDGQRIAFLRQDPANSFAQELWVVNALGPTEARVLVSAADMAALKAASPNPDALGLSFLQVEWRPGTHWLAYQTYPRFEGPGSSNSGDLRLVNVDTLEKTTLLDFRQGGTFYYSPDGSQIALSYPDHISLIDADGSNLRPSVLTYPNVITYSEYQYHPHPIWAADSGSLRVTIPPADPLAEPLPPTGLWSIPTDGSPETLLGSVTAMPFAWPNNAFSPDLAHVAYVKPVGPREENRRELHLANADGSGDVLLTEDTSLEFNMWAPDSRRFVYAIRSGAEQGIYLGDLAGGSSMITSNPNMLRNMRWLDSSRFAYFGHNGAAWELRISDVDGSRHAFIDTITGDILAFDFTP